MQVSSALIGKKLKGMSARVNWRQTMNYAAAVGDANPAYFDDTRPAGVVAPPMFAVAVTWPLMVDVAEQLPDLPAEVLPTIVHYSEHLLIHRLIRPDDQLVLGGEVAAILPQKGGTHMVLRVEATANGEPVFTEFGGVLFRGVACADAGGGAQNLPALPDWPESDDPEWEMELPVAPEAAHVYDGCTDIVFPIHTSAAFARMVGLPRTILQGTATLAMAARELVNREAGGDPHRLRELACSFTGLVLPGTDIRLELQHRNGDRLGFAVRNAEGKTALGRGFARLS